MKNRANGPATAEDRIAQRDRGREQVRHATRAAVVGGVALTALFAGIAYSGTHAKSATLVSAHQTSASTGSSSTSSTATGASGSTQAALSSSSSTPVVSSGGS